MPTATKLGELQVGGGVSYGLSDYANYRLLGGMFYTTFDFRKHLGVELNFHQLNQTEQPSEQVYERTYQAGVRYFRDYGRLRPYVKGMYGRGVLNYPDNQANLAYNMLVGGGGVDLHATARIHVRLDAEYQDWASGSRIPHGLTPVIGTLGVAYHFGGHDKLRIQE